MSGRPWAVHARFVLFSLAVVVAFVSGSGVVRGVVLAGAGGVVAVRVLLMILRGRLPRPLPWWLVVGGLTSLTVNNLLWFLQVDLGGAEAPTGLLAAVTLPLGYVGLLAASVALVMPVARRDSGGVIDSTLIAIGLGIALWTVLLHPHLEEVGAPTGERAYDLMLVLVVSAIAGAVLRAATAARQARPSLLYFLLAIVLTLVGNVLVILTADPATGRTPPWIGALWVVGYIAASAAAAHPSSALLTDAGRPWEGRLSTRRLVYLGLALGINPLVAGIQQLTGRQPDWLLLSVGSLIVVPLVLMRVSQLARLHAEAEQRLAHLANHDQLTGLPNRRAVDRHLEDLLGRVNAGDAPGAVVLFVDLDDFKEVNDTLGHRTGDELLAAVALRLRRCVRADGDIVARFGGDEFVLVLEGAPEHLATSAARRVEETLSTPVTVGEHVLPARGSVGVSTVTSRQGVGVDQLLSEADARMYERKRERRAARA